MEYYFQKIQKFGDDIQQLNTVMNAESLSLKQASEMLSTLETLEKQERSLHIHTLQTLRELESTTMNHHPSQTTLYQKPSQQT